MLLSLLLRAADGLLHAAVHMERRNALTVLCFLRRPLLMRGSFVSGAFPPADFHGLRPNLYLAGLVRDGRP